MQARHRPWPKFVKQLLLLSLIIGWLPLVYAQQDGFVDKKYLAENSYPLSVGETAASDGLQFIDTLLTGKRLVLLGEFSHGAKEASLIRNRLIRYLHERHWFKLLLLESGVAELAAMNAWKKDSSAQRLLATGLIGPWRTKEYLQLIEYAKGQDGLQLGGIDPQKSGRGFKIYIHKLLAAGAAELADAAAQLEEENDKLVRRLKKKDIDAGLLAQSEGIIRRYDSLIVQIVQQRSQLLDRGVGQVELEMLLLGLHNRMAFLSYYTPFKKQYRQRWAARDSIMAANVLHFALKLFPQEKIIIGSHNYHIAKYNEKELVMGEILKEALGEQLYSVGIFGGTGQYANNSRKAIELEPPTQANNLRRLLPLAGREATFIAFSQARPSLKNSWMLQPVIVDNSFINLEGGNALVPARCYDGLLFIERISLPDFDF